MHITDSALHRPRQLRQVAGVPLPWVAALAAVAGGVALAVVLAGAPVAWLLLGVCALATVPVAIWGLVSGRFFEPLPLLAAVSALTFVARPLQLMLDWRDLYSHLQPRTPIEGLVWLETQEISFYVTNRLGEPLATMLARALGACALFLVAILVGYSLGPGRRLAGRLASLGGRAASNAPRWAVAGALAIGLVAQIVIIARAGGPAASLEQASDQTALSESFALFFFAGFGVAGLLIWAAWHRPGSRVEWIAFAAAVVAVCGGYAIAGSRARVFLTLVALAVIVHYLWRRWRLRELVAGFAVMLAFVSSFIAFREIADKRSLDRAFSDAPQYALDPGVILNDITGFDDVVYATTTYGQSRGYENGAFLVGAVRSYIPAAIDPGKPEGGDIVLRRAVWGESVGAGRPPTAVGDPYIDFGFPGVAVWGLLIGIVMRALPGLLRGPPAGREYRVALYAIALVILYELVVDTFSLALGFVFTLAVPFLIAVYAPGLLRRRG